MTKPTQSPKVTQLIDGIKKLSVDDVSWVVCRLEEHYGIPSPLRPLVGDGYGQTPEDE